VDLPRIELGTVQCALSFDRAAPSNDGTNASSVDFVRVNWNQLIEELRLWQQLQADAKLALAA